MNILYVLVPVALLLVLIAVGAYVWAVRAGQFDDLTTPALRALHDDTPHSRRDGAPSGDAPPFSDTGA